MLSFESNFFFRRNNPTLYELFPRYKRPDKEYYQDLEGYWGGIDKYLSLRSSYSVDDHGMQNPLKRKKNQYLAVLEICDDTSLVAYNPIERFLQKFTDPKILGLEVDQRSYLRGESMLQ